MARRRVLLCPMQFLESRFILINILSDTFISDAKIRILFTRQNCFSKILYSHISTYISFQSHLIKIVPVMHMTAITDSHLMTIKENRTITT